MVALFRSGCSLRAIALQFHVHLRTVQRWVSRADERSLEQVNWEDLPHSPHCVPGKTDIEMETRILKLRQSLQDVSALGEYGAEAIYYMLHEQEASVPSIRTINRILARHGLFDHKQRVRRPAPPPGWYLSDVAQRDKELDQFDVVVGLVIEGGQDVQVLNGISLHGSLVASWPCASVTSQFTLDCLVEHWKCWGCPGYVQFDNDTRFQGAHQFADTIGRVSRLCLSLDVTPVFVPVRETGFQAAIESYNNRWQQKVWQRFHFQDLAELTAQSAKYIQAARARHALRREAAPNRRPFPKDWKPDAQFIPSGSLIYLRRTDDNGRISVMENTFAVSPSWTHRLVKVIVNLDAKCVQIYGLRRAAPNEQPLLNELEYNGFSRHLTADADHLS